MSEGAPAGASEGVAPAAASGTAEGGTAAEPTGAAASGGDWASLVGGLPEELRGSSALQNAKGFDDFVQQHVNLEKALGEKRLVRPKDASDEEGYSRLYDELGLPKEGSAYDLSDVEWDEVELAGSETGEPTLVSKFREVAAKERYTPRQLRAAIDMVRESTREAVEARAASREAVEAKRDPMLESKYGGPEGFTRAKGLASQAAEALFGDEWPGFQVLELPDGTGAFDHPALFGLLVQVGESMQEGGLPRLGSPSGGGLPSRVEVEARINALRADQEKQAALRDKHHPNHAAVVAENEQLHAQLYEHGPATEEEAIRQALRRSIR